MSLTSSAETRSEPGPTREARIATFASEGFLGPLQLFSPAECRQIAAYLHRPEHPAPADWGKGRAVHERFLFDLAIHPALLSLLRSLLGEDVVLWGASAVTRRAGAVHPWHSDIESSGPDGRFVTAWIGIENTTRESALQMISRSHRLNKTVQEARQERGLRRDLATPEAMLAVAREREPAATFVQPDMRDGDAILFDGRLWHGSDNSGKQGPRLALLLQYAAADSPVRIPDLSQLDWPFRLRSQPRPAAILVSGTHREGANRLVPAPPPSSRGAPMVVTAIHRVVLPLENATEWTPVPAFRGPTRMLGDMACHASVLPAGQTPHPPHAHLEEELLIALEGEVELVIATSPTDPAPRAERIRPGSFVYYPAGQHHTIRNPGALAVGYLMFKWSAPRSQAAAPLGTGIFHFGELAPPAGSAPFWTRRLLDGPTSYLGKLHAHVTVLQPGAGYDPHIDAYDVAIVVLTGAVETLGQVVEPLSVIYQTAGERHGMRNVGVTPARYLVFEFHAPGVAILSSPATPPGAVLSDRILELGKRVLRPVWHRLEPLWTRLRKR